jgi:chromosome segregation ATPase
MAASIRFVLAAMLVAVPSIASAQSTAPASPDVLRELLVEVRGLRAAMERAATVGARIQLLVARVQMQEQRIAESSRRAVTVRQELSQLDQSLAQTTAMVRSIERAAPRSNPEEQREMEQMIEMQKTQVASLEKRRQDLLNEDNLLSQQIAADQSRWSDVNTQLDELERSLAPRVKQ